MCYIISYDFLFNIFDIFIYVVECVYFILYYLLYIYFEGDIVRFKHSH